ncbi:MAG: hypothetical protein OXF79_02550 [Chloroflexi bacterium]|nr:hypothetical protein [Chloroflexota bacterium]
MVMAMATDPGIDLAAVKNTSRAGVVSFSTPDIRHRGGLSEFVPTASGLDYIVASSGDGYFYRYNLAEKVWMTLGLSPRCLGGDLQKVVYDDLSLPAFGVASGEVSTEYHYTLKRNVRWLMSNEYLRRYLWMCGAYGVRIFFYEALLPDGPPLRSLMAGESHIKPEPDGDWYEIDLREHAGRLLLQVWAVVVAVPPERCLTRSPEGLVWPGVTGTMTRDRANALTDVIPVYLDDRFLERYEQNNVYDCVPIRAHGDWLCSPSYGGQWAFSECRRVGRNLVEVPMRELYKPKPDGEILHAYAHVLDAATAEAQYDRREEHVVSKTQRLVDELLDLADHLEGLADATGVSRPAGPLFGLRRAELQADGWLKYPELRRLAQVSPLDMTEQAFLARCKSLHELWQRLPSGFLRKLVAAAGHARPTIKDLGSLKLLQALANILERLNANAEEVDAFGTDARPNDLTSQNPALTALFMNNDLRIADAHDTGGALRSLVTLGFDVAVLQEGYGRALDQVFDGVIDGFSHLNAELRALLDR